MRLWLILAGISGAMSVAMAAVGAHAVAGDAYAADLMEKASRYQMTHALGLLAVAVLSQLGIARRMTALAGLAFSVGIVFFCGSLYAVALLQWPVQSMTPVGGMAFIGGWLCLVAAGIRTVPSKG